MTVTWHPYKGETSALAKKPSIHFRLDPTTPSHEVYHGASALMRRLPKDSLALEMLEFMHGQRDTAPLHASRGINLPKLLSELPKTPLPKPKKGTPET